MVVHSSPYNVIDNEKLLSISQQEEEWFWQRWWFWLAYGRKRDANNLPVFTKPKSLKDGAAFYSVGAYALIDFCFPVAAISRWSNMVDTPSIDGDIDTETPLLLGLGLGIGALVTGPLGATLYSHCGLEIKAAWYENYELAESKFQELSNYYKNSKKEILAYQLQTDLQQELDDYHANTLLTVPPTELSEFLINFNKRFERFKEIHRPVFYWSRLSFLLLTSFAEPETTLYNALLGVFAGIGYGLLASSFADNLVFEKRRKEDATAITDALMLTDKKLTNFMLLDPLVDLSFYLEQIQPGASYESKAMCRELLLQSLHMILFDEKAGELVHLADGLLLFEFSENNYLFRPATLFSALFPHVAPCTLTRNQYVDLVLTYAKRGLSSNALLQGVRYGAFPLSVACIVLLFIPGAILSGPAGWAVLACCTAFFAAAIISQVVKNYKRDEINYKNEILLQQLNAREQNLKDLLDKSNLEKKIQQLNDKISMLELQRIDGKDNHSVNAKISYLKGQQERLQRIHDENRSLLETCPIDTEKSLATIPKTYIDDANKVTRNIYDATSPTAVIEKRTYQYIYDYCIQFNEVVRPFYRAIAGAQVAAAALGTVQSIAVGFGLVGFFCLVSGWFSSKNENRIAKEGEWLSHKVAVARQRVEQLQKNCVAAELTQRCIDAVDENGGMVDGRPLLFTESKTSQAPPLPLVGEVDCALAQAGEGGDLSTKKKLVVK